MVPLRSLAPIRKLFVRTVSEVWGVEKDETRSLIPNSSISALVCSAAVSSKLRVTVRTSSAAAVKTSSRRLSVSILVPGLSLVISGPSRSEEHTSELQSRGHLVCRLLLEKKKSYSIYKQ